MRASRYLIALLLTACVATPIIIGASCPPPVTPVVLGVISNTTGTTTVLPSCISGFLCVDIQNNATVPVLTALYVQNGFDDPNSPKYPASAQISCCANPSTAVNPCNCPCPGATATPPSCKLNSTQLYDPANMNLFAISGSNTLAFSPGAATLIRLRCPDAVKTLGMRVAQATGDPIGAPDDSATPVYRSDSVTGGDIACGKTVQFLVIDLSQNNGSGGGGNTVNTSGTAQLIIQTNFGQ